MLVLDIQARQVEVHLLFLHRRQGRGVERATGPLQFLAVLEQVAHLIGNRQYVRQPDAHLEGEQPFGQHHLLLSVQHLGLQLRLGQFKSIHAQRIRKTRLLQGLHFGFAFHQQGHGLFCHLQSRLRAQHQVVRFSHLLHHLIGCPVNGTVARLDERTGSTKSDKIRAAEHQLARLNANVRRVGLTKLEFGNSIRVDGRGVQRHPRFLRYPTEERSQVVRKTKHVTGGHLGRDVDVLAVVRNQVDLGQTQRERLLDVPVRLRAVQHGVLHRKSVFQSDDLGLFQGHRVGGLGRGLRKRRHGQQDQRPTRGFR